MPIYNLLSNITWKCSLVLVFFRLKFLTVKVFLQFCRLDKNTHECYSLGLLWNWVTRFNISKKKKKKLVCVGKFTLRRNGTLLFFFFLKPKCLWHISFLRSLLPTCKFIFIGRDPTKYGWPLNAGENFMGQEKGKNNNS